MNHPPKKKHKDLLLPNNDQVDDRNLIDLKDAASLSLEDRINLYWKENKGFLIGCIFFLLTVVIGYQSMLIVQDQSRAALQTEYTLADANDTLSEFARTHSDKELGGFAALKVADKAYSEEDFATALEFYILAVSTLEEPTLAGRARIGYAFALYRKGQTEEGLAELNAVTSDTMLTEATRAEAAYHLAVEAYQAGCKTEFSSYVAQVEASEFAVQWQQRLQSLPKFN